MSLEFEKIVVWSSGEPKVVGARGNVGRAPTILAHDLKLQVIGTCSAENLALVEATGVRAMTIFGLI